MRSKSIDKTLLVSTILLVAMGFFIFSSASMGLLAREGISYSAVTVKQFVIGFIIGGITLIICSKVPYKFWRKYALIILAVSIISCILVFLPKIGFAHNGARRWLNLGPFSFQPAELLKFGTVIYYAAWLATTKNKIKDFKFGPLPLYILIAVTGALLMKQPDTGTFMVLFVSLTAMFIVAGGKWRYVLLLILVSGLSIIILAQFRPYLMSRFLTFLDPSRDSLGAGYQIQQSLIAIGSGGIFGRGFGQSIQKFNFLPEPMGDSIFAVAGEEFGFAGGLILIALFLFFALRGFRIAARIPDVFGMSLTVGIITLILAQSFINIGAMLSVLPLTGIPLLFVSQGGSAMLFGLGEVGIVLNISKNQRS
jgi:cell division protein FtsW